MPKVPQPKTRRELNFEIDSVRFSTDKDQIDDLHAENLDRFRLEYMDDNVVWMSLQKDGKQLRIIFSVKGGCIYNVWEWDCA